jgi:hypothetical protein
VFAADTSAVTSGTQILWDMGTGVHLTGQTVSYSFPYGGSLTVVMTSNDSVCQSTQLTSQNVPIGSWSTCSDLAAQNNYTFVGCGGWEQDCTNHPGASPAGNGADCLGTVCCVVANPPPPPPNTLSCGQLDGDYCSQSSSCPSSSYTSLGTTRQNGSVECQTCCDWTCQSNGCQSGEYGWQQDDCGATLYCGDACDSPDTHDHWGTCGGTDICGHSFGSDTDCGCPNTPWESDTCYEWSCQEGWNYVADYCTGTNYSCDWIESCWDECGMINYDEWSCWTQCGGYWGNCQESSYEYECGGHWENYSYGCYNQPYECNWHRCGW